MFFFIYILSLIYTLFFVILLHLRSLEDYGIAAWLGIGTGVFLIKHYLFSVCGVHPDLFFWFP